MKHVVRALLLLLVAGFAFAQVPAVDITVSVGPGDWVATVYWDAVTESTDDVPLLPTDVVTYDVYTQPSSDPAGQALVAPSVSVTQVDVDFQGYTRGYYFVGVSATVDDGQGNVLTSAIAWSNDPVAVDPTTGRLAYIVDGPLTSPPKDPTGLRPNP